MRRAVLGALAALGADQLGDLGLHQLLRDRPNRLADHVSVLLAQHLPDDLLDRHPVLHPAIAGLLPRRTVRTPTKNERRGGRTYTVPSDPLLHHATGRVDEARAAWRPGDSSAATLQRAAAEHQNAYALPQMTDSVAAAAPRSSVLSRCP